MSKIDITYAVQEASQGIKIAELKLSEAILALQALKPYLPYLMPSIQKKICSLAEEIDAVRAQSIALSKDQTKWGNYDTFMNSI